MYRKRVLVIILTFAIGLLSYLCYNIISKVKEKNAIAEELHIIPEFEFETLDNSIFTNTNLRPSKTTIFIYFNSECDFCQHEAQSISENLNSFKEVQFVFVSTEAKALIKQFSETYNLNNQPKITFLHDNADIFSNRFDATTIPYLLIYDKDQQLIKKYKGQLNAKGILKLLLPAKVGI
jgi:thiol-disulfide isomerase/thioredoxin